MSEFPPRYDFWLEDLWACSRRLESLQAGRRLDRRVAASALSTSPIVRLLLSITDFITIEITDRNYDLCHREELWLLSLEEDRLPLLN